MNAIELRNTLKRFVDGKSSKKFWFYCGILPTLVTFPINLLINPDVDPLVYDSPILLGFGFAAFVMIFLVFISGSTIAAILILNSYLYAIPRMLDKFGKINEYSFKLLETELEKLRNDRTMTKNESENIKNKQLKDVD